MKKRTYERRLINVQVSFTCDNVEYTGMIKNVSNNGMYIETEICPTLKSIFRTFFPAKFNILMPLRKGVLEVPVKVRRLVKNDEHYLGIGVEHSNPQENFLAIVDGLGRS